MVRAKPQADEAIDQEVGPSPGRTITEDGRSGQIVSTGENAPLGRTIGTKMSSPGDAVTCRFIPCFSYFPSRRAGRRPIRDT